MTIPRDEQAAQEANGLPPNELVKRLVYEVFNLASDMPKATSNKVKRSVSRARALAEEVERRANHRIKYTPVS